MNIPVEKLSLLLSIPFKEIMIKHSQYLKNKSILENRKEWRRWAGLIVYFYKKRIEIFGHEDHNRSYAVIINNENGIITASYYGSLYYIKYKEILELQKLSAFL